MTRPPEVFWFCVFIDTFSGSKTSFFSRNAGSRFYMVDGDRKGSAVIVGVFFNHLRKLELAADCFAHRHADQSFAIFGHKVYVFCGGGLCAADEIALVFSVWVVCAEDDFSLTQIL